MKQKTAQAYKSRPTISTAQSTHSKSQDEKIVKDLLFSVGVDLPSKEQENNLPEPPLFIAKC